MAKKRFKKVLVIASIIIVVLSASFFLGLQVMLRNFSREISKVEINNIDLSRVEDGTYTGVYDFNKSVGAKVEVKVENKQITNINILEHRKGLGGKAEAIVNNVIDAQSIKVEAISGATGSSTIILKAIENALGDK